MLPDTSDGIVSPGSKARVKFVIPPTISSIPANGTTFKVWGHDFEVNSSEDFTSGSFKVVSSGLATFTNLTRMFQANIFFAREVIFSGAVVSGNFEVYLDWKKCGQQIRFTVDDMVFTNLVPSGIIGSAMQGATPEYRDGFSLVVNLHKVKDLTNEVYPITKLVGIEPDKLCSQFGEICVSYDLDISDTLFTEIPELTNTSRITPIDLGRSMMRYFYINYGWVYRENCQPKSGTIKPSGYVLALNARIPETDQYGMRRYWPNHPLGIPPEYGTFGAVDFLTTQPKRIAIAKDGFSWLWFLHNYYAEFATTSLVFVANFVVYKKGVSAAFESFQFKVADRTLDGNTPAMPINFNTSPGFVAANTPTLGIDEISSYEVFVFVALSSSPETPLKIVTQNRFYDIACDCENETDLYFLSEAGGIPTMKVSVDEVSILTESTEIDISRPCGLTRAQMANQPTRVNANWQNVEKVTIRATFADRGAAWTRFLNDCAKSDIWWLRRKGVNGEPFAQRVFRETGDVKIWQAENSTYFTATILFHKQIF